MRGTQKRKYEQEGKNGTHSLAFKQRISSLFLIFPPLFLFTAGETTSHSLMCVLDVSGMDISLTALSPVTTITEITVSSFFLCYLEEVSNGYLKKSPTTPLL